MADTYENDIVNVLDDAEDEERGQYSNILGYV